uniref:Nucleotide-binding, alpha-beta plait n=1 Tax=Tanacetum cinerariifolium TaxID=118510 RepID=A0A699HFZ8_TANCI|nr:nucleotide-binding, alpha-beta plait [Tanacetum cinerariifolium]
MNPRDGSAAGYGGAQNRVWNVNAGQARPDKMLLMQAQENGVALDKEQLLFLAGGQDNTFDDDVDEQPVQDLALNVDNLFQADDCNAFDSNVDEAPTVKTMFMANLSSADPVTDEAGPSYDSNILSEVQDHDHYQDAVYAHHEEHVMHDSVQLNHVVDLHADYTSDSNIILYDQYVKDNEVPVVHSNVSSVPNDAFMMIYNDMCEPHAKSVSNPSRNTVVKNSLTAELATYKEQVELSACLYNGHEIVKDNHALAIVHNTEDTLEIAEITRKKINAKMNDPECVTRKVKIARHDYSKENFLAMFTPQKQLTPEQIFRSSDLINLKSKALKERTKVSRPIKALTVYPPNTPATLVPKVLPTKSQVKIHIFTLIQLFLEFDKTCKKWITPTGLTEGERGFEQTRECYLKKVIPFFKTLKDNFKGIQKALTKQIKEIKDVFEELEAEVSQYVVDRKHDAIKRKNLLIANDSLIAECLSKEVFSVATNSKLNVAQFTKLTVAHTDVDTVNNRDAHLDYLRHLKESVETIRDIVEEAKVVRPLDRSIVSAYRYNKHSQELLEYAIGTCPQGCQQRATKLAHIPLIRKKQVTVTKPSDKSDSNTHIHVVTVKPQTTNIPAQLLVIFGCLLKNTYAPHSTSRKYTLKTQLLRIKMHGDETPDALAAIGEPVKDKDLVMLVVSGLREEYNGLKTTITARQSPIAFSELHALLSDHDYMLGKTRAPAPSITSSFAANYAVGSPSMPKARLRLLIGSDLGGIVVAAEK